MPIDETSYKNFYLGNGAEYHIMSELFLHGYEASKMTPDIGIDILVTNKARQYYEKKEEKSFYFQVKSTFLINDEAIFYLKEEELNFLISDPSIYLILCYFSPEIAADPKSLAPDNSDTPFFDELEAGWMKQAYEENFRELKRNGNQGVIEFKRFDLNYLWLNNKQIKRAMNENVFEKKSFDNAELMKLTIKVDKNAIEIDQIGNVCPELQNIFYLLNGCSSSNKFNDGCFSIMHC